MIGASNSAIEAAACSSVPASNAVTVSYDAAPRSSLERRGRPMGKQVRVGDVVQLASGVSFKVTFPSDPARPWRAVEVGGFWRVQRPRIGHRTAYFCGGQSSPMRFTQADAEAVAAILNTAPIGAVLRADGVRTE